ncbi:MAG: GNAT family N-acetyltransferase, partial [Gammaproteobacteria bacterium]|nr:GNAT family N-acetyltransferase [Gammaproteobacteria bacterium]
FETCYYQGIDICIAEKLQRFDAGAQGEHKLRRGFEPVTTCSYHWIKQPQFAKAINDYCKEEMMHIAAYKQAALEQLPFRRDQSNDQGLSMINEDN